MAQARVQSKFPTLERLKELLDYDSEAGVFYWKIRIGKASPGMPAGCLNGSGRHHIRVDGKYYTRYRLAWFYFHGVLPKHEIDHKNRVKNDDRIDNLREATRLENRANTGISRNSLTGFKGVCSPQSGP